MPDGDQPKGPQAGELELEPLEAHIVALRAQLRHHERLLVFASAAVLAAAVALLLASRAKVPRP
jgi:uncharacterized membrane protein YjjP (DUF1212 family)